LDGGGAEKVILKLAGEFVRRDLRCDIVIAINQGRLLSAIPAGVRLVTLDKKKTSSAILALASYIRREKPSAMMATIFSANITAIIAKLISFRSTTLVIREAAPTDLDIATASRWKTWANRIAAQILYRRASASIAVSREVASVLMDMKLVRPSAIHIIPNPVLLPDKPEDSDLPRERGLILACGRLEPQKDHASLLRAVAKLSKRCPDSRLIILGEGTQKESLEQLACELGLSDRVTFAGYVDNPAPYMAKAAVLVHTARFEGFSSVLLEALAQRCPIVATDCQGVRAALGDGAFGTIVPLDDEDRLVDAVEDVLSKRTTFPDPGQHLIKFDLQSIVDRYLSILLPEKSR
jgi:glycosyltransferase involved in cell wall biosynthesis